MVANRVRAALLLCLLGTGAASQADVIKPTHGAAIVARLWEQGADEVTFNIYRTGIRRVTLGTQRLPAKAVKQVQPDPDPYRSFWNKAATLANGSADDWQQLGAKAAKNKLRGLARLAFVEALVRDPAHAAASVALDAPGKKLLAADPRANAPLREQLAALLALPDFAARQAAYANLQPLGCDLPFAYLERAYRSRKEPKGRTDDRLLTLRGNEYRGVYTLFVPEAYDPMRATPLLVGLHGGGPGGKDGKRVVGSGSSAMNFYEDGAKQNGYLVVCPTALAAPWSSDVNDGFLLAVLDEVTMLFNVDRNRIYLTGHSMGGYGAWHYGVQYAHLWAAIAPMAGAGGDDLQKLRLTLTGVYLYHGANDEVVGADWDRRSAERMRGDNMDFVYAEIPDSGHGFPAEVNQEMWQFFASRRLAVAPGRAAKGRFAVSEESVSSFLDKPGKEEAMWFGALDKDPNVLDHDAAALLRCLRLGGGLARRTVAKLVALGDADVASKVAAVVTDQSVPADGRAFAADALGQLGDARTAKALQKGLGDPDLAVVAAAAFALGTVADADTPKRYEACLGDLKKRLDATMVGMHIDLPDYRAHLATVTRLAEGATKLADPACGKVLAQVAQVFLLPKFEVEFSERAGDDPAVPRRQLTGAVLAGCRALPGPAVKDVLEALASRDDLGVVAEAKELLAGAR
ncbi:MAG TPA: HEAT repeat domain-containing protein [Planctomycetota bacterium]|nr:HEAT repeat domain-containing protein [Planctomycetota bacterium]